jgi:hypothetical protein
VVGFKPNATKMTAHHMLVYGCEEPGQFFYHFFASFKAFNPEISSFAAQIPAFRKI